MPCLHTYGESNKYLQYSCRESHKTFTKFNVLKKLLTFQGFVIFYFLFHLCQVEVGGARATSKEGGVLKTSLPWQY